MLKTPFVPLADADFRRFVADRTALPGLRGNSLYVAKWSDGPGMDPDLFLAEVHARGATLEVRQHRGDVNIRIVGPQPSASNNKASPPRAGRSPSSR